MTEHPAAEHPSPVTPQTEAGRDLAATAKRQVGATGEGLARSTRFPPSSAKPPTPHGRKWWSEYWGQVVLAVTPMRPLLGAILDSLARPVEEETPEQKRIRNAPEHSEEGWSR